MTVSINGYPIDAAITEEFVFDSDVTDHPVEEGADVTDHVRAKPLIITLDCIVSDTPIGAMVELRDADIEKHSTDAYAQLQMIQEAREPVFIDTSLGRFVDMVLQSLSIPRASDTGDALKFKATFKQVIFVTNARTTVRVSVPRAAKKVNRGNKPLTLELGEPTFTASTIGTSKPWSARGRQVIN